MVFTPRRFLVPLLIIAAAVQIPLERSQFSESNPQLLVVVPIRRFDCWHLDRTCERASALSSDFTRVPLQSSGAMDYIGSIDACHRPHTGRRLEYTTQVWAAVFLMWAMGLHRKLRSRLCFATNINEPNDNVDRVTTYTIYLCHFFALCATNEFLFRTGLRSSSMAVIPRNLVIATIILVISTEITFRLIETPLRRLGHRVASRIEGPNRHTFERDFKEERPGNVV